MRNFRRWPNLLTAVGAISLVLGSFDPIEGSALILPGTGLLALGSYLGHEDRRLTAYRTWSFALVAFGVAALFALSAVGGVGERSSLSAWWALLIVPYLVGWSIDMWGPGSPRWLSAAGLVIGTWYIAIFALAAQRAANATHTQPTTPMIAIAVIGIGTIIACVVRLWKDAPSRG